MSIYDKRIQRDELSEKLVFLTIEQRDRVLDALDAVNERFDITRAKLPEGARGKDSMQLLQYFLDAKKVQGCSQETISHYKYVLLQMLDQMDMPFVEMTTHDIMAYFTRQEEDFGLCAKTRAGHRTVYNSFFTWLATEEFVPKNPMLRVPPIKVPKEVKTPYSKVDVARLEGAAWDPDNSRDLAIIHFLRSTACRISEMCRLNIDDLDMTKRRVKVYGKGAKERYVHFDDETELYLKAYLAEREDDDPALFIGRLGRLTPGGVRAMLKRVAKRAGVKNVHPHKFRRTQATDLLRKGMPLEKVSRLLGHTKLDTTMTYIYLDDEDIAADYKKYA